MNVSQVPQASGLLTADGTASQTTMHLLNDLRVGALLFGGAYTSATLPGLAPLQPSAPGAFVGLLAYDTTAAALKVCTSISPVTWSLVSIPAPIGTVFGATATSPGAMTSTINQTQFVTAGSPVVNRDSLSEFTASNGRLTLTKSGTYKVSWAGVYTSTGVTFSGNGLFQLFKNGSNIFNSAICSPALSAAVNNTGAALMDATLQFAAGDFLNITANATFSAGAPTVLGVVWNVLRLA